MDTDRVAAAFDDRAAAYARSGWHVGYAERLVELMQLPGGAQVLDAATGTGFAALAAMRKVGPSGKVLGVDVSEGMLERARAYLDDHGAAGVQLMCADASALGQLPDESFDAVICSAGLLYMPVHQALCEWRRVLRYPGIVGFSTMRAGFPVASRIFRMQAANRGLALPDPAEELGHPDRCRQALTAAGFTVRDIVEETVRFSAADLAGAWEAHARGAFADAVKRFPEAAARGFRAEYEQAIADLLRENEVSVCDAQVIYAIGDVAMP